MSKPRTFWCSWGRHRTIPHPELKEQYANGTICMECQFEIMGGLEKVTYMPEISEAMRIRGRKEWSVKRSRALASAPLHDAAPDAEGIVYYARISGHIKIGYTTDLTKRSKAYPPDTELLAVEPGDRQLEHRRHVQFARYLQRGREWFTEGPTLIEHIEALAKQYRVPHELMHSYTKHRRMTHA